MHTQSPSPGRAGSGRVPASTATLHSELQFPDVCSQVVPQPLCALVHESDHVGEKCHFVSITRTTPEPPHWCAKVVQ